MAHGQAASQKPYTASAMGRQFGDELKRLRLARSLSLRQAAQAMGISHMAYANYEQGVAVPPPERRDALARALGMPRQELEDLIEDEQYEVFLRARPLGERAKQAIRDFLRHVRERERRRGR